MAVPYQYNPQAYATQINNNCRCEAVQGGACPAGQTHLRWTWTSGGHSSYWDGCTGFCNPMNCSNTTCSQRGCANARTQFCSQWGKQCGSVKKCYGPQGQDPCPAACTKTTDDAVTKVIENIFGLCHPNCGACNFQKDTLTGILKTGYQQGIESIRKSLCSGANIGGMTWQAFVNYLANRVRCAFINDPMFVNCRGGCPGGTCNGRTCPPGQKLNSSCNCVPLVEKDPWTDFFGSWCHTFDFLPWGGCNNQTNTLLFLGGIALLVFVLWRRV